MELLVTQDLEPLPFSNSENEFKRPEGLLNSTYKSVAKCSVKHLNSNSIFGIKQRVKSRQYHFTSGIATLLKVSVFVIALAFIM